MHRRGFVRTAAAATASIVSGCGDLLSRGLSLDQATLTTRPSAPTGSISPGYSELGLGAERDGLIYVPESYSPEVAAPLLVLLHGGAHDSSEWRDIRIHELVDPHGVIVLAPSSRGRTWEATGARPYGDDAAFIDAALRKTFQRCNIHPDRIGLGGFSDGASEAVSLGVTNGNLFRTLLIMSPGIFTPAAARGTPRVFVSHAVDDPVLPVEVSSQQVVPWLLNNGYSVTFNQFTGGHAMHAPTLRTAIASLAQA